MGGRRCGSASATAVDSTFTIGAVIAATLVGLGGFLDYIYTAGEKAKMREKLEKRLYSFNYLSFRTFGRAEIEFAILMLERFAGSRFFSVHRWITVASIEVVALLIAWPVIALQGVSPEPWNTVFTSINFFLVVASMVSMALSFSLSIFLSKWALRIRGGTTLGGVLCLLLIHAVLLVVWRPLAELLERVIAVVAFILLGGPGAEAEEEDALTTVILFAAVHAADTFHRLSRIAEHDGWWVMLKSLTRIVYFPESLDGVWDFGQRVAVFAGRLAALFANSLRIAMSLGFLVALLYVRVLRRLIIRIWSAFIQPEKAFFTIPASALAAFVLLIENSPRIASTLARQFG